MSPLYALMACRTVSEATPKVFSDEALETLERFRTPPDVVGVAANLETFYGIHIPECVCWETHVELTHQVGKPTVEEILDELETQYEAHKCCYRVDSTTLPERVAFALRSIGARRDELQRQLARSVWVACKRLRAAVGRSA